MRKFYLCDMSKEHGTGDDSFYPVMDVKGYDSYADAYLAARDYVADLPINENPELQIRSECERGDSIMANTLRASSKCRICGADFPHCHSRKEIKEGTVDLRTSKWWLDWFESTQNK